METASVAAPSVAEPQQQISDMGRVIGVLTSPSATFADIARKPKWVTPILLSTILGLAFAFVMNQRIDWQAFIVKKIEQSPRGADMPAEQKQRAAAMQANISKYFTYGVGACAPILMAVIWGAIYMVGFNVMAGAGAKFKTSMSIMAHAGMTGLVFGPITMLVMYLRDYGDVDPENMIATNLASFLPEGSPAWLNSMGQSVELFSFWSLFLVAIGFSAINPKRIGLGKALGVVGGIWVIWTLIKAGLAAAFA